MKIHIAIFVLLLCSIQAYPANIPASQTNSGFSEQITIPAISLSIISKMKVREVEKTIGRKLKLKEKIAVKVFQWKIKRGLTQPKPAENKDNGKTSFILGLIGLAGLVVPGIGLFSLPLAIIAIAVGNKAKKLNPDDKKARTGVTFGWITIGILVTVLAIVLLVIAIPIGPF